MAVQAQYPPNVLLLNNRGTQEGIGTDCAGGGGGEFLNHRSPMLFSHGGPTSTRKRGREASVTAAAAAAASNNIASSGNMIANPFTLQHQQQQSQPLQLIDLSQLQYNHRPVHQPAVVSTGLRLAFNDQHQHKQGLVRELINSVPSDDFAAHIRNQRDEIDQFLLAQGEQLRRTMAEKRQRHYRALLGAAEEAVARRLREKEAEVEKAARRNAELEALAAQLSEEAQVWQAKARAQEAAAASLQAQLQQAIISGGHDGSSPEECGGGSDAEDAESAYMDPNRAGAALRPSCRVCRGRAAAVVVLPCRHLCVCAECDRVAHSCPVCFAARESSVEVYLP